jgi:hypothetical protein
MRGPSGKRLQLSHLRRHGPQLLPHVVHLRQRQMRMLRLPRLAERVQLLAGRAELCFQGVVRVGEGEGVKAGRMIVGVIIPDPQPAPVACAQVE